MLSRPVFFSVACLIVAACSGETEQIRQVGASPNGTWKIAGADNCQDYNKLLMIDDTGWFPHENTGLKKPLFISEKVEFSERSVLFFGKIVDKNSNSTNKYSGYTETVIVMKDNGDRISIDQLRVKGSFISADRVGFTKEKFPTFWLEKCPIK